MTSGTGSGTDSHASSSVEGSDATEWLTPGEDHAWNAFFEMQVLFWRQLARQLQQETGLSEPDFAILQALARAPLGRLRAYELSGVTQFEKSRLHHHLTRMAERGLLSRERCPDAPRGAVIALTPAGRETITTALPHRVAHIRQWLLTALPDDDLRALTTISQTLIAHLRGSDGPHA